MRSTLAMCLGALALCAGCAGPASSARVNGPEEEKLAVQASNEENRIRTYVERFQEAKARAGEYRGYVAKAEGEVDRLSAEINAQREASNLKQRELQTVKDESKKLEADLAHARQELARLQQEATTEETRRRELATKLEELRRDNSQTGGKIDEAKRGGPTKE